MVPDSKIIGVLPVGDNTQFAAKVIAGNITGYLSMATEVLPPAVVPSRAYDSNRSQYNAAHILKHFENRSMDAYDKILAVLDVDLFIPIFTHVFGESRQAGKWGLVSLYRLSQALEGITPSPSLVFERAAKVGLHELGHLFDLHHCENHHCIMHFSADIEQLDRITFYFCRYCTAFLNEYFQKTTTNEN